jgi:hypothetical protein
MPYALRDSDEVKHAELEEENYVYSTIAMEVMFSIKHFTRKRTRIPMAIQAF